MTWVRWFPSTSSPCLQSRHYQHRNLPARPFVTRRTAESFATAFLYNHPDVVIVDILQRKDAAKRLASAH